MAIAGRVAIVPKDVYDASLPYKRLDAVMHNNTLYIAKKNVPAGTAISNTEYWSKSIVGSASAIATTEDAGVVKPDGKSMSVDESGTLSINLDGTTITLDEAKNVIKLADTLKEKIGSALQPESIVNNQVTTEAGFALDARQANPNIDGTLAKKVSDLNGSLNTKNYEVTDKTILEYINSTNSFIGSQTFIATCTDNPTNNIECNIFWFGSNSRITVLALEYVANYSKLYKRDIFNREWRTEWIEL